MRVLMTTDTIGGVWTFTRELSSELLAKGCAIAIASFGPLPSARQKEWIEQQSSRWRDRFLFVASDAPLERMADNRKAFSAAAQVLMPLIESFRPHALLSSQYCFGALPVFIPRIVVAHSDVLSLANARRTSMPPSEWLDHYRSIVSDGIGRADAIVAPTQWMLDALGANFALPTESYVIPNGCTLPPARLEPLRKLQAVTAGRLWDEAKNLRILEQVESSIPILIAGAVKCESASFRPSLARLQFLGNLEPSSLHKLFRQSAIYICTSIYEPFGFAPIEAAQCGCIVVANDIPSLREVWGDSALFFEDSKSLSILLGMLQRNSRFRARARKRSELRALHFTSRRMAGKYFDLLRRFAPYAEAGSCAA